MTHAPQYLISDFSGERFPVDRTLESFPLWFAVRLLTGVPLQKTVLHKGEIAEVLALGEHIRQLQVISDLENYRKPLWSPRRASDRQRFRAEQQQRHLRLQEKGKRVFRAPCWTGEPRPVAETRELFYPSVDAIENLRAICSENHLPFLRSGWVSRNKIRRSRGDQMPPEHRKEAAVAAARLQMVIGDHGGWSEAMRRGVTEIVLHGMRPGAAAQLTGENPKILSQNARRVEEELARREQPAAAAPISG